MPCGFRSCGWLILGLLAGTGRGAELTDRFADRQVLTDTAVTVVGSNAGATLEPGEPRHGGKPGGHSVWISWIAPANGLLSVSTAGSTFDTLLAVYVDEPDDDPPLERLEPVAEGDDEGALASAALGLGARAGERYEIAIDGYAGATGEIQLRLEFIESGSVLPRIVRTPGDQALRPGDTLILTVDLAAVANVELRWYRNGEKVHDGEAPTLVIPELGPAHTGLYELELELDDLSFFSAPIEVQLNTEGVATVLARNKLEDALASGLGPGAGPGPGPGARRAALASVGTGVTRGYNGSQVFNSAYATRDPGEPQHCGVPGGPSYWFAYQPPAGGTLRLDTEGSDYDTLLAVYTYDPPLTGYEGLLNVGCDNNSGTDGRAARLAVTVDAARTYLIVVDGVNGARGVAHLNYALTAPDPPSPVPVITRSPQSQVVAAGATVALTVQAAGAPPLTYRWLCNGQPMPGETNGALTLVAVQPAAAGTYVAVVSNMSGEATTEPAVIDVRTASRIAVVPGTGRAVLAFPAPRGYQYRVEVATNVSAAAWTLVQTALADAGSMVQLETDLGGADRRFYRLLRP